MPTPKPNKRPVRNTEGYGDAVAIGSIAAEANIKIRPRLTFEVKVLPAPNARVLPNITEDDRSNETTGGLPNRSENAGYMKKATPCEKE